jgi:aminopeptidase N
MLPRDSGVVLKRRQDYRPPPFLVDALELELDLVPDSTAVVAHLEFRRNPYASEGDREAPLTLDGEQQESVEVELDGAPVAPARLRLGPNTLTLLDPPASGTLTVRSRIAPGRNVAL